MKRYTLAGLILVFLAASCAKNISEIKPATQPVTQPVTPPPDTAKTTTTPPIDTVINKPDTTHPLPPAPIPVIAETPNAAPAPGCPVLPIYGDTIIYPQPTNGGDYIFNPVNNPGPGKYMSWPQGMIIDPNTGAINVTKSETGLKYAIGFVKNGTTDTCISTLVIGGVAYMDSVYVLANGATTALPYFDGDPFLLSKCNGGGCSFDVTGTAAAKKVIVNGTTGVIDLQKTLSSGLLGGAFGLIPVNGQVVTTSIYYKLNDASNDALQHIDVQVVYYDSKANMAPGLLSGIINSVDNLLAGHLISTTVNPRPPLIVIVRRLN